MNTEFLHDVWEIGITNYYSDTEEKTIDITFDRKVKDSIKCNCVWITLDEDNNGKVLVLDMDNEESITLLECDKIEEAIDFVNKL